MPYAEPYFLDGTSLIDSTSIYTNSELSIFAADGYYSDGLNIRRLVSGVLEPVQPCPSCGTPCGTPISGSGAEGKYTINIDTGSLSTSVGAIVITFDPYTVPDGVKATFDGVVYNEVVSPVFGYLASSVPGSAVFIGSSTADCGISGSTYTLNVFDWDGTAFVATGGTDTITVDPGQMQLTASNPNPCKMVIPKITASPSLLSIEMYGPCPGTGFEVNVECPVGLDKFKASLRFATVEPEDPIFCDAPQTQTYFVARLGNATAPYLGLYDMIFEDSFGQFKLADGYYRSNFVAAPNDGFEIQNGVIVALLDACP